MRKRLPFFFILAITLSLAFILPSFADTGPKPSVNIDFINTDSRDFYVTLLSVSAPSGPWYYDGSLYDEIEGYGIDKDIWDAFLSYDDTDGFHLLPYVKKCKTNFKWSYYPPSKFKALIYFPNDDIFAVSKIYERYAFDSYFEIDIKSISATPSRYTEDGAPVFEMECIEARSYDYKGEAVALMARILITLTVEILIAYLFGFITNRSFFILITTNVMTQIFLNTALNVKAYFNGISSGYYRLYALCELLVFTAEASIYLFAFRKNKGCQPKTNPFDAKSELAKDAISRKRILIYAFVANLASFIVGIYLSRFFEYIF